MKEYVFSFKDRLGRHIARFEGKDENAAFKALQKIFPDAEKLAGFPVDDTVEKILSIIHYDDPYADDGDSENDERKSRVDAIEQFKANLAQFRRQKVADSVAKETLERGEMQQDEWNTLTSSLTPEEKKELYDEFMADADKNHKDKKMAKLEKKFVNYIFGIKDKGKWTQDNLTIRDLAQAMGISHVRVLAIQKSALTKLINNIAEMKHYPFKIKSAEEAISLLLADNVVNPQDLHLKAKVNGGIGFDEALKKMVKMEKAAKAAAAAKQKQNEKARRKAMDEFKKLEKETNALRDKLGLPRCYERFFKYFASQKLGNWA